MGVVFPLYFKGWMVWKCMNEYIQFTNVWYHFFLKWAYTCIKNFSYKTPSIWFEFYLQSVRIMTEFKNYFLLNFYLNFLKKIFRLWIVAKTFPSILQNNVNGLLRSFIRGPFWTEMIGLYESRNLLINERGHCKLKFSVFKLLLSFYARQGERKI